MSCRLENEHHDCPCAPPKCQLVRRRVVSTQAWPFPPCFPYPSHLDSPSRLDLECPITPHFAMQPRPSDRPSWWPTPLVRAALKKLPTNTVLIVCGPLQVRHWSGLLPCLPYPLLYLDKDSPFPFSHSPFLPTSFVLDYRSFPLSPLIFCFWISIHSPHPQLVLHPCRASRLPIK